MMRPILLTALRVFLFLSTLLLPLVSSRGQDTPKEPGEAKPVPLPPPEVIENMVAAHNKVRAEEKLPPLKANTQLSQAAQDHALDMAAHNELSHEGSDGSDPAKRIKRRGYVYNEIGENVAFGGDTVADAMRSWVESPPHLKNILGDFSEMGVGMAKGSDGNTYWAVELGRPMIKVDPEKSPVAMIAALNRARADRKKTAVKQDTVLTRVAGRFASEAASRRALDGKDSDGQTPFDVLKDQSYGARRYAMTLASGEGDPAKVLSTWLERDEDRETLLSKFDRIGVGVATDKDGVPYWIILLAQTRAN